MVFLQQAFVAAATVVACASAIDITVSASGGNDTGYGQTRYGFLHEDINNSGDGGIYAELVRNRAFQGSDRYPTNSSGYYPIGGAQLSLQNLSTPLSNALPTSLRVSASSRRGAIGFENDGWWGMDVKRQKYTGSFWVKGEYHGSFTASLRSNLTDDVFGSTKVRSKCAGRRWSDEWVEHKYELTPHKDAPNSNNTLAITFEAGVSVTVNIASEDVLADMQDRAHARATSTSISLVFSLPLTRIARMVCASILPKHCTRPA